jgi:hypothetical protein
MAGTLSPDGSSSHLSFVAPPPPPPPPLLCSEHFAAAAAAAPFEYLTLL